MKLGKLVLLVCPLFTLICGLGAEGPSVDQKTADAKASPETDQAAAIAAIEKLGGKIEVDLEDPDRPVIGMDFSGCDGDRLTDGDLAILEGLTRLQRLSLHSCGITDAGLEYLGGLTELRSLNLDGANITDAGLTQLQALSIGDTVVTDVGMEHLKGLKQLRTLDLGYSGVTDAGLEHLAGLKQLHGLDLTGTGVTDAGME